MTFSRAAVFAALAVLSTLALSRSDAVAGPVPTPTVSPAPLVTFFGPVDTLGPPNAEVTVPVRISAGEPGIGAFSLDIHFDPDVLTPVSCDAELGFCSTAAVPDTVSFAAFAVGGITGEDVLVGAVTFSTPNLEGATTLTVGDYTLYDADDNARVTADPSDALVSLVAPLHTQGNIDCLADIGLADVAAFLAGLADVGFEHLPGCTPLALIHHGATWGDLSCDGLVDAADALVLLNFIAGQLFPAGGFCPTIGAPLE